MTTMTNAGVILEVQKLVEDWALVGDIRRFQGSPLTMPHILQQDPPPSEQELVMWFYSKVFHFATEEVRPSLVSALRKRASVPIFESLSRVPSADKTRYGIRCATDLINFWSYVTEEERLHGALDGPLLVAVLDHVSASISTSLTAIYTGDGEVLQRALRNLRASLGRITTANKANPRTGLPAVVAYPTIVENAQEDLVRRLT
jgi:hypothetical protein